ncbi:MAG: hypothetical protein KJ856_05750 [Gammaproteobacteria bacterium]|uniref:Putative tail protein n=1 Tax=viral metagenome TaxID=1070528 RepID=A0A6H1ZQ37_9ZZZZ|nr:hypothetical protein [Gammaproteobacteria bacterium]MBU1477443.1 hypothetical protein [Gammaproteobacteria bacterium]MBU2002606.1 hypothetical protein [Gammaproteobacteria bacterium]MBU2131781.1 hypothetical protein [Gammaproteobacteria bacterium]MBU2186516.1 hypothetical protein [Gammaproteobacteria bacterium]
MFGECCPFVVPKVLMRASYVTASGSNIKQILLADNVAQTILFNQVTVVDPALSIDLVTGEVTALKDFSGMASLAATALREQTGAGEVEWGVFIEGYDAVNGWQAFPGSLRPVTMSSQTTNEKRTIDYTLAVEILAGTKFRWRHYTSDASRQVSIVSFAAANGLPSSAGAIMSFWGVKP